MMRSGLVAAAIGISAVAAAAQLAVLGGVAPGEWQLKESETGEVRALCVSDPGVLLQLAHGAARCTRTVLDDGPKAVTVNYVCPGAGRGRSTLTVRSGQVFRLETQGMVRGAPFAFDYEARRLGDCDTKPANPDTD